MLIAGDVGPSDTKVFPDTIVQLSRCRTSVVIAESVPDSKGCAERNSQ